jgi:hypothetical protein
MQISKSNTLYYKQIIFLNCYQFFMTYEQMKKIY